MHDTSTIRPVALLVVLACALSSCSLTRVGVYASDAFLGEEDPAIAGAALPSFMKVSEVLLATNPSKQGNATTVASLWLLYATAFLDGETLFLPDDAYLKRQELTSRARALCLRAYRLLSPFVEKKSPGFFSVDFQLLPGADAQARSATQSALKPFKKTDADLMYYTAASILAAFSSDPLDFDHAARVPAAIALLEGALSLAPDRADIQELAFTVYASMPADLGGSRERAVAAYESAMEASGGKSAGLFVSHALIIRVADDDAAGFKADLERALAISASDAPRSALMNALARRKAAYLLEHMGDYVLDYSTEGGIAP